MPSSSRRKQAKPQHLANEKGELVTDNGNQTGNGNQQSTSDNGGSCTETDAATTQYKTEQAGDNHGSQGTPGTDTTNGLDSSDDQDSDNNLVIHDDDTEHYPDTDDMDCQPADLSAKVKVSGQHDSKQVSEDKYQQQDNDQPEPLISALETVNSNIAQQASPVSRKRHHDDVEADYRASHTSPVSHPSIKQDSYSHVGSSHSSSHVDEEDYNQQGSKRLRYEGHTAPLQYLSRAIPPHLETFYDLAAGRVGEERGEGLDARGALTHACQVCPKLFPKASDLKRHMMCHTGEKPFRCKYCQKPFRAKSSMNYHLKATHGIDIELSPGLEERYLRMKTRAQMNLLRGAGHLADVSRHYRSDSAHLRRDNIDYDDYTEDECKSNDSSVYHNSGIGSDVSATSVVKSQGIHGHTGTDTDKCALDLSMAGKNKTIGKDLQANVGEVILYGDDSSVKKSKLNVKKETVLVTKLDGMDVISGENTSLYKCYLCTHMFSSISRLQCHLSLHFDKHILTYQCCFCDELYEHKSRMQQHLRRKHSLQISTFGGIKENGTKDNHSSKLHHIQGQLSSLHCLPCSFCHKLFGNKISLHKHKRLHFSRRNCYCRSCGKTFNQYTSLQLHISRVHFNKADDTSNTQPLSWVRNKLNFFKIPARLKRPVHKRKRKIMVETEPLNLSGVQANGHRLYGDCVAMVTTDTGDLSDHGLSLHSSDNNLSETLSDTPQYDDADDYSAEIRSAPKKYLLPSNYELSPRSGHSSWNKHLAHLAAQNSTSTSYNSDLPLNFAKSDSDFHDSNNNDSVSGSPSHRDSPELPTSLANPESLIPGYNLNATSHLMMAKALMAHQTLTQHLNSTSQPMIFPPNHLPPSLAAMTQMMSLPVGASMLGDQSAGPSKSPSPVSHSSKSEASPEERDAGGKDLIGVPRVNWTQDKMGALWNFNMYSPDTGHTDGRKVTSLSRTHSRLGIVQSPINRESLCKPSTLADGRTIYKCPFCAKEFVSYSDINRHMDFHEGKTKDIRPYKCQYCDYFARTNSQLKVHMMRHQGIREFCCKLCNYKGVTQSDLNRHMKSQIHMLKSRNACTYCGEGFVTSKNLEKHLDGNCIVKMQKLNGGLDIPLQERVA